MLAASSDAENQVEWLVSLVGHAVSAVPQSATAYPPMSHSFDLQKPMGTILVVSTYNAHQISRKNLNSSSAAA